MEEGDYIKKNENIEKTLFLLLEPEETDSAILQRFVDEYSVQELFESYENESYEKLGLSMEMEERIHALRQMTFLWGDK